METALLRSWANARALNIGVERRTDVAVTWIPSGLSPIRTEVRRGFGDCILRVLSSWKG